MSFLDVIVPILNETLVVNGIDHCELGLGNDSLLIEIVADDFCERGLTSTGLSNYYDVNREPYDRDVLARAQIGIGVDNALQLCLHLSLSYHFFQQVLVRDGLSAPFAELCNRAVSFMTIFANHYALLCLVIFIQWFYRQCSSNMTISSNTMKLHSK